MALCHIMEKTLEFGGRKGRNAMGITSSTKVTNVTAIPCGSTFNVTLALTAAPDPIALAVLGLAVYLRRRRL